MSSPSGLVLINWYLSWLLLLFSQKELYKFIQEYAAPQAAWLEPFL